MRTMTRVLAMAVVVALATAVGCSREEEATPIPAATATPTPPPLPPPPTSPPTSPPTLDAGKKAPDSGATAGVVCGDKPLPPCPLYAWMKANTSAAMSAQDLDALADALDKVAGFAPPGYPNWVSISKDGASAARGGSLDAVKASCRGCHKQYKDRYKKELRDRPIGPG